MPTTAALMLGIDPGINNASWALITEEGDLVDAGIVYNPYETDGLVEKYKKPVVMAQVLAQKLGGLGKTHKGISHVSFEWLQGHSGRNFYSLCSMSIVNGAVIGSFPKCEFRAFPPNKWKGRIIDKDTVHAEIVADITAKSRARLNEILSPYDVEDQHNIFDAIGVALFGLKELRDGKF